MKENEKERKIDFADTGNIEDESDEEEDGYAKTTSSSSPHYW